MAEVRFKNITKKFGETVAVRDFTLDVPDKEFLVLVGPSGCGKSTTLRLLAGLEEITEGDIYIGDRLVNNIPPKDRDIAMVFQSYALYPHMTVYDNMAFGLALRKTPKAEIGRRVNEAARILGIQELLKRKPRQLSGGQRQRVALGRAIVREPAVFLLDEPLSNLDAKLRVQTRAELSRLHQRLGGTFIYVTHDQTEAMTMATRIAVMNEGTLQQLGTPQELYEKPANLFVAGFIGSPAMNFFEVAVNGSGDGMTLESDTLKLAVPADKAEKLANRAGRKIHLGIRPEHIYDMEFLPAGREPGEEKLLRESRLTARVDVTELMGNEVFVYLVSGEKSFLARVDARTRARPDHDIDVAFNMKYMQAFDMETGESLL